jgi:DNA-binding transcriptional MerR regulator
MKDSETFTTPEVARIIGLSQRKLASYIERGYASPSVQAAAGHGTKRLWSYRDVIHCATIKHLLNGLSVETVREIAVHLHSFKTLSQDEVMFVPLKKDLQMEIITKVSVSDGEDPYSFIDPEEKEKSPIHLLIRFRDIFSWVNRRISQK